MNEPWKKFSPLWPSRLSANFGFRAAPAQPVDEQWANPWPTIMAEASGMPPTLPASSAPPQGESLALLGSGTRGGLLGHLAQAAGHLEPVPSWNEALTYLADRAAPIFPEPQGASLNVGARGGFLGNLAQAAEYFDATRHRGIAPEPASASRHSRVHGFNPSPPRQAPDWNLVPSYPADHSAAALPEPQSQAPWSASTSSPDRKRGTSYGGGTENGPEILSDVTPDNHWIPGADYAAKGHHELPQAKYKSMPLETRKVFNAAKTGRLYVDSIDRRRHEFDKFHRQYNDATGELLERFMEEHGIADQPHRMTPDHARAVLKLIAESEDPRIRLYGEFIRRLRMFYRLRGGDQ